ncbi:MAG: hypothetical protein ACR2RD_18055, partial [Woeseiaceae bacterium]
MTRFIAIKRRSYDTWRMRFALTLLLLTGLALLPARSDAFALDQADSTQQVQLQGKQSHFAAQNGGMTLAQAIE